MLQRYFLGCLLVLSALTSRSQQALEFVRNDGQWNAPFTYKSNTGLGAVFLADNSFTYVLSEEANSGRLEGVHHGLAQHAAVLNFHAYRLTFEGAGKPVITGSKEQKVYYNYFLGNDPKRWHGGIHPNLALDYTGLYDGVDMHVASQNGNLKYEFILHPGVDPSILKLRIDGADALSVKDGNLVIKTSVGEVKELKPFTYQYIDGERKEVSCRYKLKGNIITYDITGTVDPTQQLVIDPVVVFCTFTGSTADNWGFTATYDAQGNFYAGGSVFGAGYPVSTGAYQSTFGGGVNDPNFQTSDAHGSGFANDIGIMKFDPTGANKIYATYIGGSDNEQVHSLIVDGNNNLVLAGRSYSSDFPVTTGAFDVSANGAADIVLCKLNSTATAMIGSTYLGGSGADGVNYNGSEFIYGNLKHNYGDDARSEVLVDKSNNIYLTSSTMSGNFPVTGNATQSTFGGSQDAIFVKMNPTLTSMIYGTFLGGSSPDAGYVMALDTNQSHVYVGGGTMSSNFPSTTGTWHTTYQGGTYDGFIVKFLNSGAYTLQKSCFVGTSNEDQVYGLQVDLENNVYTMGQSLGGTFPVTSGVYTVANSSQFVMKMDPDLSTDMISTIYGTGDPSHTNISPVAFLVDTCQNVYISGWGGNLAIPTMPASIGTTTGLFTTANAAQSTTDGYDFYFIVFSKNIQTVLYSTFYGRSSTNANFGEHVDGGTSRFDKSGVVYQAICGGCGGTAGPSFPTTAGSYSPANASSNCNEVALKIAFQLSAVNAGANASPNAKGCPPFTVQFQNGSVNATGYEWNFGDNTPVSSAAAPVHTFTTMGVYHVRLIALNPLACKTRDTTFLTITVDTNHVKSDFNYNVLDSCGPYRASFANNSTYGSTPNATSFTVFTWLFGDNTSYTGVNPPIHNYANGGTYTVLLIMKDTTACNSPDTMRKTITLNGFRVTAAFTSIDSVCLTTPIQFNSNATHAATILWRFGDWQTSTANSPVHNYTSVGNDTVWFIAYNPASCNKVDSVAKIIHIKPLPKAAFTSNPLVPVPNRAVDFTNQSLNAATYQWSFGDGSGSVEVNPSHLFRHKGHFLVCLTARSTEGCQDSVCKYVDADIKTAVDLPTAFSPNGDGSNDVLYVRGGAIEDMDLKIFNRWGQLVFETTSLDVGWDGTYKGKQQEMDAYAFILTGTFIDGTSFKKKGNVTLIR